MEVLARYMRYMRYIHYLLVRDDDLIIQSWHRRVSFIRLLLKFGIPLLLPALSSLGSYRSYLISLQAYLLTLVASKLALLDDVFSAALQQLQMLKLRF